MEGFRFGLTSDFFRTHKLHYMGLSVYLFAAACLSICLSVSMFVSLNIVTSKMVRTQAPISLQGFLNSDEMCAFNLLAMVQICHGVIQKPQFCPMA